MTTSTSAIANNRAPAELERWQREASFFDAVSVDIEAKLAPMAPSTLARYTQGSARRRFNKEYRFRIAGDLEGKKVLDVGCGDGENAVLLASAGARVTGIDVSPGAIDLARRRAEMDGVSDRVSFICAPVETAEISPDSFDVVWCDAILHHLLHCLDDVARNFALWCKPGGQVIITEPVSLSPLLRKVRKLLPIAAIGTPDERPLEDEDLRIIKEWLPGLEVRAFGLFSRLDRFVLDGYYEHASAARKTLVNLFALLDYGVLSLPALTHLGGVAVMRARL